MGSIKRSLPYRLPSNVVYDSILVTNLAYDPVGLCFKARVFGVCGDLVIPLVVVTMVRPHLIEEVTITDAEIDAVIAADSSLAGDRVGAAFQSAFNRLKNLYSETQENPYA